MKMAKLSQEERDERYNAMKRAMTDEKEALRREKAKHTMLSNNQDVFREMGIKARKNEPYEVKAARALAIPKEATAKARAILNSRKFRCLVTGKVSTCGPLTRFQMKRGIDPSLREELFNLDTKNHESN